MEAEAHPERHPRARTRRARVSVQSARVGALGLAVAVAACAGGAAEGPRASREASLDPLAAYLREPAFRRRELEASLVSATNDYARRRLAAYTEERWGALPEWNPPTAPARFGPEPPTREGLRALPLPRGQGSPTEAELLELGRVAFVAYPLQVATYARPALARSDVRDRYGLEERDGAVNGVVVAEAAGGALVHALTCATCHSTVEGGRWVPGKTNARLRLDRLIADEGGGGPELWGPGRVDVTSDGVENPTAITDLRPVRFQVNLHKAATVRNGLVPLAIRIETLCITSLGESHRPPREVALGLALYVRSLGEGLAPPEAKGRGREVFSRECAACHAGEGLTGPAVPLAAVSGNAPILESPERTTGTARVPSLRGVGDRAPLLSAGEAPSLDALLAPPPASAPRGHAFGQALSPDDRASLLAHLRALR